MNAIKITVNLVQQHNPRWVSDVKVRAKIFARNEHYDSEFVYKVTKVTNSITPSINETIMPSGVQSLIDGGVTVNITDVK